MSLRPGVVLDHLRFVNQLQDGIGYGQLAHHGHDGPNEIDCHAALGKNAVRIGGELGEQRAQVYGQLLLRLNGHGRIHGLTGQVVDRYRQVDGVRRGADQQQGGAETVAQRVVREVDFAGRGHRRPAAPGRGGLGAGQA